MRCEDALKAILDARYDGREPPKEALEVLEHNDCRELLQKSRRLDALMMLDEAHEPGPGFDTRFFAKLKDVKSAKKSLVWPALLGTLSVGTAVAALIALTVPSTTSVPEPEPELAMIQELEFIEELEGLEKTGERAVVEQLEDVEAYELLAAVDLDTLNSMIGQELP